MSTPIAIVISSLVALFWFKTAGNAVVKGLDQLESEGMNRTEALLLGFLGMFIVITAVLLGLLVYIALRVTYGA